MNQLALTWTGDRLELRDHESRRAGVFADLTSFDQRTLRGQGLKSQPLAKAIGTQARTVIDATAGFGHDSALLVLMGHVVTAIERSPVMHALLVDGLRRAMDDERVAERFSKGLSIVCADAREHLQSLRPWPDVVYIDPMFPPKRKASALAKKSIRLVRAVVGNDPDSAALLDMARTVALQRVVVKRPTHAEPLMPNPTMTIDGTLVRYDVYRA